MHVFFNNYCPLETIITIEGIFRMNYHPIHLSSVKLKPPEWSQWVYEFLNLIYYGPLYNKLELTIPPHTQIKINIESENPLSVVSGFKNKDISWGLLKEGSHELDTSKGDMVLNIETKFDEYMREHAVYGRPAKVENISIFTTIKSDNDGWHTIEEPVTIVSYHPNFKEQFWKSEINSKSI